MMYDVQVDRSYVCPTSAVLPLFALLTHILEDRGKFMRGD